MELDFSGLTPLDDVKKTPSGAGQELDFSGLTPLNAGQPQGAISAVDPNDSGATQTFFQHLGRGIPGGAAALASFGPGFEAGAALGAPLGPGAIATGLAGGVLSAFGANYLTQKAVDSIIPQSELEKYNTKIHPYASTGGDLASQFVFFKPGLPTSVIEAAKGAGTMTAIGAGNRALEASTQENPDYSHIVSPTEILKDAAMGTFLKANTLGKLVEAPGQALVSKVKGIGKPVETKNQTVEALNQAADGLDFSGLTPIDQPAAPQPPITAYEPAPVIEAPEPARVAPIAPEPVAQAVVPPVAEAPAVEAKPAPAVEQPAPAMPEPVAPVVAPEPITAQAPKPVEVQPPAVEAPKPVEPARSVQTEMPGTADAFNLTGEQVAAPREAVVDTTPDMLPAEAEPAYVGQARTQLAKLESAGKGESPQAKTLRETIEASKPKPEAKPVEAAVEPVPVKALEAEKPASVESKPVAEPQGVQDARGALAKMEAAGNGNTPQAELRREYIRKHEKANGLQSTMPEPAGQAKPVEAPVEPVKAKKPRFKRPDPITGEPHDVTISRARIEQNKSRGSKQYEEDLHRVSQYENDQKLLKYDPSADVNEVSAQGLEDLINHHQARVESGEKISETEQKYYEGASNELNTRYNRQGLYGDPIADLKNILNGNTKMPTLPKGFKAEFLDAFDWLKEMMPIGSFRNPKGTDVRATKGQVPDYEHIKEMKDKAYGMIEKIAQRLADKGWTQLDVSENGNSYDGVLDLLNAAREKDIKRLVPKGGLDGAEMDVMNNRIYGKGNADAVEAKPTEMSPDEFERRNAEGTLPDTLPYAGPEGDNPFSRRDSNDTGMRFEGDAAEERRIEIQNEKNRKEIERLAGKANDILAQVEEGTTHEDRFGVNLNDLRIDTRATDTVSDAKDFIQMAAEDVASKYPEVAKQLNELLSPAVEPVTPRNPARDANKASELDRRIKVNAENRKTDSEGRRGYQGIVDRAIFEARKNGEISDREIQGLTRILNYVGGRFFEGVKLSIRQSGEGQMGQYDSANRIVSIFKEAIEKGKFEDTAAHEVAHHLSSFLPEADRVALRSEWQSARNKFLKENPGFAKLVGDPEGSWNNLRIKGMDLQAMAKLHPELTTKEYFRQIPGTGEPIYKVRATDETYRLFDPNEWFAETFKDVIKDRLKSDPTYTGEQATWKSKLVDLWNTIKTNFRQMLGKDQAQRILSNFANGRYEPESRSSFDINSAGHETFNSTRDSIDNPDTVETEIAKGEKPEVSVGGKVYRSVTDAAPVKFFKSIATRMRAVASSNPQSEAVSQVVNDFALTPGTKGEAAKTDYNTDVSRQREVFTNRLSLALGPILKDIKTMSPAERTKFNDLFVRAVEGRLPKEVGGEVGKSVKAVKDILAEMHQYGIDAGLDIGKVSEYFPRATNYDSVVADPEGFVNAAAKAYEMKWNREQAEAAKGQTTMDLGAEAKPDFKEKARAWRDAILLGEEGIDFERGIFDSGKASNSENFQKERVFTPQEAEQFDAFREKDIPTLLSRYTGSLVRRAEVARRLGAKGEGWADAKKRMFEQGVSADDIKELEKALKSNLGVTSTQLDPKQSAWMDANNVIVTAAYLRNTGLLNLVEPGAIGVRTGNVLDTPRVMAQNLLRVRNVVSRQDPSATKAAQTQIEAIYGKGHDIYSALGLEMGLTSVRDGISSPSVGFHGDEGYSTSGKLREAVDNIHRLYGIQATEVAKRETALREGSRFIDKTLSWANGENGIQKAFGLTGDTMLATDRLAELGINKADIPEFSKWVKEMRAMEPDAQLQRIMDRNDPMAAKYRNALGVFSKQSVVQATSASKQIASKDTPLGRLFFQLSTYVNEWSSQQGRYLGEQAKNIVGKNGYSGMERLMASGSFGAFALLSAGYYGLAEIRKLINGNKEKELKPGEYPHWVKDSADAVMWTGIAGPGEMIWKYVERGQTPAGVLGNMASQSIKAAKEFADNPDSNAKQKTAAKLAYRVGVVPAVNTALAAVGGPIPAAAAQVVAGSRTERAFADTVAGPSAPTGRGVGPVPPKPPAPPRPPKPGQ